MSTAGIFQLIANDSKQGKLLMATDILKNRLTQISIKRKGMGYNPVPTLADIEKTHVLYVNSHFKPFAAISYEYNRIKPTNKVWLGDEVKFKLPQFGDFMSDMVLNVKFLNADKLLNLNKTTSYNSGGLLSNGVVQYQHAPFYKWCDYPGERIIQKASFEVNGQSLEKYTPLTPIMNRNFLTPPNKINSYKKCMGQEVPEEGYLQRPSTTGFINNTQFQNYNHRPQLNMCRGMQTSKYSHTDTELWVPLQFWFCKGFEYAIPSASIPFAQKFIVLKLANQEQLVQLVRRGSKTHDRGSLSRLAVDLTLYVNNLFMSPEVVDIYIKRIGFHLIRISREQVLQTNVEVANRPKDLALKELKWPVETLFVGFRNQTYHTVNNLANMSRWNKFGTQTSEELTLAGGLLTGEKYTGLYNVDTITSGNVNSMTLKLNSDGSTAFTGTAGATYTLVSDSAPVIRATLTCDSSTTQLNFVPQAWIEKGSIVAQAPVSGWEEHTDNNNKVKFHIYEKDVNNSRPLVFQTNSYSALIDELSISSERVNLFAKTDSKFYNSYIPFRYGDNICSPDNGLFMINFALNPGIHQPTGHINVSKSRNFVMRYTTSKPGQVGQVTSAYDNTLVQADVCVVARTINFLLISDGNLALRYVS